MSDFHYTHADPKTDHKPQIAPPACAAELCSSIGKDRCSEDAGDCTKRGISEKMFRNFWVVQGYRWSMTGMAVFSAVLALVDLRAGLNPFWQMLDTGMWLIFAADYIVRLVLADKKKQFFKSNLLDLIAVLPLNSALRLFRAFRILKVGRLAKLAKISRLAKAGSAGARLFCRIRRFLDTNGLKYVLLLSAFAVAAGGIGICMAEDMSVSDGLWWAFVTATTVGYGDLSPVTNTGRVIAALLMLVGIGLIGSLTSSITSYFLQEPSLKPDGPSVEAEQAKAQRIDQDLLDHVATENLVSTDKIEMVKVMYDALSKEEQKTFRSLIQNEQ